MSFGKPIKYQDAPPQGMNPVGEDKPISSVYESVLQAVTRLESTNDTLETLNNRLDLARTGHGDGTKEPPEVTKPSLMDLCHTLIAKVRENSVLAESIVEKVG